MNLKKVIILLLSIFFIYKLAKLAWYQSLNRIVYPYIHTSVSKSYKNSVAAFWREPQRKVDFVFLGDSITRRCPIEFANSKNRGIDGDISAGVLERLDEALRFQPSRVFLMIGANDLEHGVSQDLIVENQRQILEHIRSSLPKTEITLQSVLPANQSTHNYTRLDNREVMLLNEKLRELSYSPHVFYLNVAEALSENGELRAEFSSDGTHLSQAGCKAWQETIRNHLYKPE